MSEEAVQSSEPTSEVTDSTQQEASQPEATEPEQVEQAVSTQESEPESSNEEPTQEEVEEVAQQLYEIVVDGESQQVPLDELLKGYQLKSASNKRFQEASQIKKQVEERAQQLEEFKNKLLENPYDALVNAGLPFEAIRKHYEDVMYQMLQLDQMSPEEKAALQEKREAEKLRSEYEQLKKQLEEKTKQEEEVRFQQEVERETQEYVTKISEAAKNVGLPETPEVLQGVADIMRLALENGYNIPVEDAVAQYKEETTSSLKNLLGGLNEDALLALIGEDRMKNIRKKDIETITNPGLPKREPTKQVDESTELTASDFFDSLRESYAKR